MNIYYVNGEYVPSDKAVISVNDMIVLRGYGVFDFLRTYNKIPFHLCEHINRLKKSAHLIGLDFELSYEFIEDIVKRLLEKNNHKESNIRIILTGGISRDSLTPGSEPGFIIMAAPIPEMPGEWYRDGVKIITSKTERFIPRAKSTNYMNAVISLKKARASEAMESIYVDRNGRLLEGTTTNIFFIINNKLVTPGNDILPGVTRDVLLNILKDEYSIEIRDVYEDEINQANEIFITATNKEIVPVVNIDDIVIGNGKVGKETEKIKKIFDDYTSIYQHDNFINF